MNEKCLVIRFLSLISCGLSIYSPRLIRSNERLVPLTPLTLANFLPSSADKTNALCVSLLHWYSPLISFSRWKPFNIVEYNWLQHRVLFFLLKLKFTIFIASFSLYVIVYMSGCGQNFPTLWTKKNDISDGTCFASFRPQGGFQTSNRIKMATFNQ